MFMSDTAPIVNDPTLQLNNNQAPGGGVPGKTPVLSARGWGASSLNESKNQNTTLTGSNFRGTVESSIPTEQVVQAAEHTFHIDPTLDSTPREVKATPVERREITETTKKVAEFYETPTDLMSYEDMALVNPRDLAVKLLSKVQYDFKYCVVMLEFFLSRAKYRITTDVHYQKDGSLYEKERHIPNAPPMFSEFGRTIGVSERTIKGWAQKHLEFQEAYEICQDIIQEFFIENGVKGEYASQFGIFAAKNLTKMKDVIVNENKHFDMKGILDSIEKGSYSGTQ